MTEQNGQKPDHTLGSMIVPGNGEEPKVFAVTDLKAYINPDLDKELGSPGGGAANPGTATVCACVPVEDCVCNTVEYHSGSSACPDLCSCQSTGGGSLYWFPY